MPDASDGCGCHRLSSPCGRLSVWAGRLLKLEGNARTIMPATRLRVATPAVEMLWRNVWPPLRYKGPRRMDCSSPPTLKHCTARHGIQPCIIRRRRVPLPSLWLWPTRRAAFRLRTPCIRAPRTQGSQRGSDRTPRAFHHLWRAQSQGECAGSSPPSYGRPPWRTCMPSRPAVNTHGRRHHGHPQSGRSLRSPRRRHCY